MEHFDVMKFVKENDARVQRHYEKMQELERKEKELSFQQIYRNNPPMQNNQLKENIPPKQLNYTEEEPAQYTYELKSNPIEQNQSEHDNKRHLPFSNEINDEEIGKEYNYTPINPSIYKLSSNSPDNITNNSYLSNQRMGYGTNFNKDFTGISSLNITNNNLNDGMKTSQSAFATSKLSYNPINMQNEEYKPIDNNNNKNNTNFEFKNNIDTLGSSPLDSQKRNVNEDNMTDINSYLKQNMVDKSKGYGKISEEDIEIDYSQEQKKNDKNNIQDQRLYHEHKEINDKEYMNQPKNKRLNKNADLDNLKPGSSQNINSSDEGRIDTKKSKKKTTPRFNSLDDDNTIEDNEYQFSNTNKNHQRQNPIKGHRQGSKQHQKAFGKIPYKKTNDTSNSINTLKKYNGKMDNVSRMQQYNNYWKKKPYTKNKQKQKEEEATSESRVKMNKLQFLAAPLRYYSKM